MGELSQNEKLEAIEVVRTESAQEQKTPSDLHQVTTEDPWDEPGLSDSRPTSELVVRENGQDIPTPSRTSPGEVVEPSLNGSDRPKGIPIPDSSAAAALFQIPKDVLEEKPNKAKDLTASFDWNAGPVYMREVQPGEKFFRYGDPRLEGDVPAGNFLVKDDYRNPPEAIEAAALDYWNRPEAVEGAVPDSEEPEKIDHEAINYAVFRQELTCKEPCVVLEGPIKGGEGTQTVLLNRDDYYSKFDVSEPESYGELQAYIEEWRGSRNRE